MRLFRNSNHAALARGGCAATIGSFDGLHQGHHGIVQQVLALARQLGVPSAMLLFEPQPAEFFQAEAATRIYPLRRKLSILKTWGVEYIVCLRFNQKIAAMSPTDFIKTILLDGLHVRGLVIGEDFCFGKARAGDKDTLQKATAKEEVLIRQTTPIQYRERRISSSWVREAIRDGDFAQAQQLLGRPFELSGRVVHGDKQGKALGFPTANLAYGRTPSPLRGVYTGVVTNLDTERSCLINAGYRPTFDGRQYRLEVHIPNVSLDLYGRVLTVRLEKKIREEKKFASGEELKQQIKHDIKALETAGR